MKIIDLFEKDPCWKGYKQLGMKRKNKKEVPNCVPEGLTSEAIIDYKSPNNIANDHNVPGNINEIMAALHELMTNGEDINTAVDMISDEYRIDPGFLKRYYFKKADGVM